MNDVQAVLLTPEGWRQLHDELAELQRRRASLGALSQHDPASGSDGDPLVEVSLLDQRIEELQRVLQRAIPVDPAELVPGTVGVGSCVTVRWGEGERLCEHAPQVRIVDAVQRRHELVGGAAAPPGE